MGAQPKVHLHAGWLVGLISFGALALGACSDPPGTLVALANFDNDTVDARPNALLPGDPQEDILSLAGQTLVRGGPLFATKYLEITRGSAMARVRLLRETVVLPYRRYKMALTGAVTAAEASIEIRFVAATRGEVSVSFESSGAVKAVAAGATYEIGRWELGVPHTITVDMDLDSSHSSIKYETRNTTRLTSSLALTQSNQAELMIELSYPPTTLEAFPGTYNVDRMSIAGL